METVTTVIFALHILSGAVAMISGVLALCVSKGGRAHRASGDVFVVAMLAMAISAGVLGAIRPGQTINIFIAALTLYLVATAWLTTRRKGRVAAAPEIIALTASLLLCAPFALIDFQIVTDVTVFKSAFKIEGAILIALCVFSGVMATAAIGDLRVVVGRGISGTPRIARHLWRMCFALALTFGSAFTNGFARLLPGPYHVPPAFFAPQLLMLLVLVYWVVRVRFPGWAGRPQGVRPDSRPAFPGGAPEQPDLRFGRRSLALAGSGLGNGAHDMAEGTEAQEPEGPGEAGPSSISPSAAMAIGARMARAGDGPDPEFDAFLRKQSRLIDLQTEHLHEQRELILSRLRWGRFSDRLKALFQAITVLVGVIVVVAIAVMAWLAHEERGFVIAAFTTPPALVQQGLTGEALAGELMDHISTIDHVAEGVSLSRSDTVRADHRDDIKVEIPETGLSLTEVWRTLRDILGSERKIEGDLRQAADGSLVLTVRVADDDAIVLHGAAGDVEALEQKAAERVYAATNAPAYVIYLETEGRVPEAITEAQTLAAQNPAFVGLWSTVEHAVDPIRALALAKLAERDHPDSPYAWFEVLRAERDLGHAEVELFAAAKLRERMRLSRAPGLSGRGGDALRWLAEGVIDRLSGDYAGAARADEPLGHTPQGNPFAIVQDKARLHDLGAARDGLAEILIMPSADARAEARARYAIDAAAGDWPAAEADAKSLIAAGDAARLKDPIPEGIPGLAQVQAANDTPLLVEAELRLGKTRAAETLIASTPTDAYDVVRERGRVAAALGDPAGADRWFAEAVRQAPSLPFAYRDWAEALLARGQLDAALAKLQVARGKGPRFADVAELEGEARMAKKDYAGAIAAFVRADKLAPNWRRNHLLWGEALRLSGKTGEAAVQETTANRLA